MALPEGICGWGDQYFFSNAPGELPAHELDRAATLRQLIEAEMDAAL